MGFALLSRHTAVLANPLLALVLLQFISCSRKPESGPPYPAESALETFRVEEGFRVELYASEPMVSCPVAMDFDKTGDAYVVEMPGYPLGGPEGRIKKLEDTDGDGRADRMSAISESLTYPTGVLCWRKGVIITDAPDILYLEDQDGDGRADTRRVLVTGFPKTLPLERVRAPILGPGGWIYVIQSPPERVLLFPEFADRGTEISFPSHPVGPSGDPQAGGFRFHPDSGQVHALPDRSISAHAFDGAGNRLMAGRDLHIGDDAGETLSDHGNRPLIYPITVDPFYPMLAEPDCLTAASAMLVELGNLFPGFEAAVFLADATHGLIHCDLIRTSSGRRTASRLREHAEFLSSTDSWFRPMDMKIGPDGALYVVDFYRPILEHPELMPDLYYPGSPADRRALYKGSDRGRIYRIVSDAGLKWHKPQPGTLSGHPRARQAFHRDPPPQALPHRLPSGTRDKSTLKGMVDARQSDSVQRAAIRALSDIGGEDVAPFLLARWKTMTTSVREEAAAGLVQGEDRMKLLLDALDRGAVSLWSIGRMPRFELLRNEYPEVMRRARNILLHPPAESEESLNRYSTALAQDGDRREGEGVYRKFCARCHPVQGEGVHYGPDLATVSYRARREILMDILLPSRSIALGYESYSVETTRGGERIDGVLGAEDSTSITLVHEESQQTTVLREDISRLRVSDVSAMPSDLACYIDPRQMSGLLEFLKALR